MLGSARRTRTLTIPPAPRPGPRLRRGRSKARAPMARKLCLLARGERGFVRLMPFKAPAHW
ncbi:hypothetical protein XdyCFBP7245_10635 [Xanthomonas dyei]|uniref:Uncharacterized protein n=1 Tax=Xanthomonas dyei TaxID=743699 RepID=A0A2S7C3E8_9XANT|nr:hypothetical protein XdyCFBP7245_10635 [Xanthomonas dyei]